MNPEVSATIPNSTLAKPAERIISLDVFRGITMILMIFVNDLAEIKGLPWWTYHAPGKVDAMTYVDMVFPAFLFIMGMAVPLAIEQRLKKFPSAPGLWGHVLLRTLGLLVLGAILANASHGSAALMGMPSAVWTLLALTGAILFWLVPPKATHTSAAKDTPWFRYLRFGGLALMIVMLAIFRRTAKDGHTAWLDFSYPEILGLLGYAYLTISAMYILTRQWRWAPLGWFLALMAFCVATTTQIITFPRHVPLYFWPVGSGASSGIAMAGVVLSVIFFREPRWTLFKQKASAAFLFAGITFVAAYLLTPLGISKIRATPTWCLYSIASSILLFTALYWLCDVRRWTRWAAFTRPAGSNTLLTYLLPDLFYFVVAALGTTWLSTHWSEGSAGILRAIFFTAVMLAISALLTRLKVRLQL